MNTKDTFQPPEFTQVILESIADGVFTIDHHWRLTSFNRAAEKITGVPQEEAIGRYCWEVFRSNMCEGNCALKRTMSEGKPVVNSSTTIISSRKKPLPITVSTSLLRNRAGDILGGVEVFRDVSLVEELRDDLDKSCLHSEIVNSSPKMKKVVGLLEQVADSDSTVLITGETGTGKELMARALHKLSERKEEPFIALNCGALPDSLLESELFGYKSGAFTDARKDKPGIFAAAGAGTILLDEIGDTSPAFQVRLLRVLEEREYIPLGGTRPEKTNVRLLAATNRDLAQLVTQGSFRKDLYYRINIISLALPPLRERTEDILPLAAHFIKRMNRRKNRHISGLDQEAQTALLNYDFPGNIRELENIIEHAFILCRHSIIAAKNLPEPLTRLQPAEKPEQEMHAAVETAEREEILKALSSKNYNRTAAAEALGIHKSTLFRKIKRLGISLPDIDGRSAR